MNRILVCFLTVSLLFCNRTSSLLDKGAVNLELGDYRRARSCFEEVVNRHPASARARLGLGKALLQQWTTTPADTVLLSRALVQLEAARTLRVGDEVERLLSTVWYRRAEVCLGGGGDTVAALKALSRATSLDPKATRPLNMAAILYFQRGEQAKALNLFRLITTIDTASVSGWFNMGMVYWADSSYHRAADAFFEAARRSPDDQEVLRWAAMAKKYTAESVPPEIERKIGQ